MKIPEIAVRTTGVLTFACLCGLLGCSQAVDTPSSSVRANAMEDYQAGRFGPAIAGFERVLKSDPRDYLAHFQLATLLQEQRKDYLDAIVHFRLYLDMRPSDDKTTLAADRIEECLALLLADRTRKAPGVTGAHGRTAASAAADKKLAEDNARLSKEASRLRGENKNLRYLLSKLGESSKGRASNLTPDVKKMLADLRISDDEAPRRRPVIPTDRELLDDDGEDGSLVSSPAVRDQISRVKREEEASGAVRPSPIKKPVEALEDPSDAMRPPPIKKPPLIVDNSPEPDPKPVPGGTRGGALDSLLGGGKKTSDAARPSTYTVQPGDNLMTIAVRFYGSRSKWHDIQRANMTTISTDGRVKAGQVIKLP